jgi:hypothetical protein
MIRGKWTDIPISWTEYQEARVEALVKYVHRLEQDVENLRAMVQHLRDEQTIEIHVHEERNLPSVLVPTMPVPPPPRPEMMQ